MSEDARTHRRTRARRWVLALGFTGLVLGDLLWTLRRFPARQQAHIFQPQDLPPTGAPVLILGAGVYGDGEPTPVLEGRLRTALDLWRGGRVTWFLVSGDNRTPKYNEPQAMRRWLVRQGVPPTQIVSDYAGRRTYDSLKRAQVVFGQRRMVIVTSDFHLPRALYLARAMGLEVWGVSAPTENQSRSTRMGFWFREYLARNRAILDRWYPPSPVLGPREPTPDDLKTSPVAPPASR